MEARRSIPHFRQQSSFNLIALIVVLWVNVLSRTIALNGRTTIAILQDYPSLFTPIRETFWIWGPIYLSLLMFAGYQLWLAFSRGHETALDAFHLRMKGWFLANCICNACWLFAWHYDRLVLSAALIIALYYTLLMIHRNFRIADPKAPLLEKVFVQYPFGFYMGWVSIAVLSNTNVMLISLGLNGPGMPPVPWTIVLLCIGAVVALWMIFRYNNIAYGLACVWGFYGVVARWDATGGRESAPIVATGTIILAALVLALILQIMRKRKSG
ncbi:hypothetical protein ACWKWU_13310 [Chitinophaga lutea]